MRSKVCVVTGATAGIGQIAATELARRGAHVVIVGRSSAKCAATQEQIRTETGGATVDALVADLSALAEVKKLAGQIRDGYPRLDVLLNNAGAMFWNRCESTDGIEKTFALNHLSYFALTALLLPMLKQSAPARIVNVASDAHKGVSINFDDIQFEKKYRGWKAYQQSKLANVCFTYELARRLDGTNVTANTLHPGFVHTNFLKTFNDARADGFTKALAGPVLNGLSRLIAISPEQGARTSVYLASSPDVEGVTGQYFVKEKPAVSSTQSHDRAAQARLWRMSEEMTGVKIE
jgi:NAD(P)-dependent dehydrogenase (short-subunit alcohol dehydrogenase family)